MVVLVLVLVPLTCVLCAICVYYCTVAVHHIILKITSVFTVVKPCVFASTMSFIVDVFPIVPGTVVILLLALPVPLVLQKSAVVGAH